jgi:hypothetical protein
MNSVALSVTAVTLVAGTVIYSEHQQVRELTSTVNRLNVELAGFDELKARLLAEMDLQNNLRVDSEIAAAQFQRNQPKIPSAGYGQPLQPFK